MLNTRYTFTSATVQFNRAGIYLTILLNHTKLSIAHSVLSGSNVQSQCNAQWIQYTPGFAHLLH